MDFSEETFSGSAPDMGRVAEKEHIIHVKNYDVELEEIKQRIEEPAPPEDSSDYGDDYDTDADSFENEQPVRAYSAPTETAAQARRREQQEAQRRKQTKTAILATVAVIFVLLLLFVSGMVVYNSLSKNTDETAASTEPTQEQTQEDNAPVYDDYYDEPAYDYDDAGHDDAWYDEGDDDDQWNVIVDDGQNADDINDNGAQDAGGEDIVDDGGQEQVADDGQDSGIEDNAPIDTPAE